MKKEKDNFLDYALKSGRIKSIEEAFKEYPVEEEDHQGNAYYYLKEDSEKYNKYSIGDIVFVRRYKYKNGKEGKDHLFVVIEENNLLIPIEYLTMLISSNLEKLKYNGNKLLEKDAKNNLKKDSIVKTDVIYRINENQILFKIGQVDIEQVMKYRESFKNYKEN